MKLPQQLYESVGLPKIHLGCVYYKDLRAVELRLSRSVSVGKMSAKVDVESLTGAEC